MANTTFKSWFNSRKWYFKEHHLEWLANELDQIINSTYGPAGGNTTVIGSVIIDNVADGATTIGGAGAGTFSGQFAGYTVGTTTPANPTTATAGGRGTLRGDPRGTLSPIPPRQSPGQITPTEGFVVP